MHEHFGNLERKLKAIQSAVDKRIDQQDKRVQAELDECFDAFRREYSNTMDDKQHMLDSALQSVKNALNDQFHVLHAKLMHQHVRFDHQTHIAFGNFEKMSKQVKARENSLKESQRAFDVKSSEIFAQLMDMLDDVSARQRNTSRRDARTQISVPAKDEDLSPLRCCSR